jgi:hypothetical protein
MKIGFVFPIFFLFSLISIAQDQMQQIDSIKQEKSVFNDPIYKLFPTENYWTFIKLDTRNGKMWQVHFSIDEDGYDGQIVLNSIPFVTDEDEIIGRFTLYPTNNMYNFLLLDQINGGVFQVQWSMEERYRGVIPIY